MKRDKRHAAKTAARGDVLFKSTRRIAGEKTTSELRGPSTEQATQVCPLLDSSPRHTASCVSAPPSPKESTTDYIFPSVSGNGWRALPLRRRRPRLLAGSPLQSRIRHVRVRRRSLSGCPVPNQSR